MSKHIITELSGEEEALIASYREKWKAIGTLTQPIDRDKVVASIREAYLASNYPEPEILFSSSPFAAIQEILTIKNLDNYLGRDIHSKFLKRVVDRLRHLIERQFESSFFRKLINQIEYPEFPNHLDTNNNPKSFQFPMGVEYCVKAKIINDFDETETNDSDFLKLSQALSRPAAWSRWGCTLDFCISVLAIQYDRKKWQVFRELMQCCDFIFQFENVCVVCERPNKLLFDERNLLHAEGEPALEFADGYKVYAFHGGPPPEGRRCQNGEYIKPGTKVKLPNTGEYGIVIHCWYSDEIFDFDCYVAFFGTSISDRETDCRPYILRYAVVSLEVLE